MKQALFVGLVICAVCFPGHWLVSAQGGPISCPDDVEDHPRKLLQDLPFDCYDEPQPPSCKGFRESCVSDGQCCSGRLCAAPTPFTSDSKTCTSVSCDDAILYNLGKISEWMKEKDATKYTKAGYDLVKSRRSQLQKCTRRKSPKSAADKMQNIDELFEGPRTNYPYETFDYTGSPWQPLGNPLFGFALAAAYNVPINEGVSCFGFGKEQLCQGVTCNRSSIRTPAYLVASSSSGYERWSTSEGNQHLETAVHIMKFWYKKSGWSFRSWVERKRTEPGYAACAFLSG